MFRKIGDHYLHGNGLYETADSLGEKSSFNAYNYIDILKNIVSAYLYMRSVLNNDNENEIKINDTIFNKITSIEKNIKTLIIDFLYIIEGNEESAYYILQEIRGTYFLNKQAIRGNKEDRIKFENIRLPIYPDAINRSWSKNISEINNIPLEFNMDNIIFDDDEVSKLLNRASKHKILDFFESLINSETLDNIYNFQEDFDGIESILTRYEMHNEHKFSIFYGTYRKEYMSTIDDIFDIFSTFKSVKLKFTDLAYYMDLNNKKITSSEVVTSLKTIIELFGAQLFYTVVYLLFFISYMSNIVSKNDSIKIVASTIKRKYEK